MIQAMLQMKATSEQWHRKPENKFSTELCDNVWELVNRKTRILIYKLT